MPSSHISRLSALRNAALAGFALLLGVAVLTLLPRGSDSTAPTAGSVSPSASADASSSAPSTSAQPSTPYEQTAAYACIRKVRAGDSVVDSASSGVSHMWNHVEAYTKWKDGELSTHRKVEHLKTSSAKAPNDKAWFVKARGIYDERTGSCDSTQPAQVEAMGSCPQRLAALQSAVKAADVAMTDWASHAGDEAALRSGALTGAAYTEKFRRTLAVAPGDAKRYLSTADAVAAAPSCP